MRVYLDDRDMGLAASSLAEALRAGVAAAESSGRIIIEMKADGSPVGDDELARADQPSSVQELRLISADARTLVRVTFLDAASALEEAKSRQTAAAQQIQAGQTQAALADLEQAVATWQLVQETLDKGLLLVGFDTAQPVNLDAGQTTTRIADEVRGLKSSLHALMGALQRQDWPDLSDMLAFDMAERINTWQQLLHALAEQVRLSAGERGA